ncbi:hypothetical protein [Nocardia sp. NPDC051570]|uniref:hypothetical protein n=1 Tax=Nocardia sp. NPDC051570 TaxID=3364324 RepID=UPI0037A554A5
MAQISTHAEELAARFDARPPHVESGMVSKWRVDGVQARFRKKQPVVVIGPVFTELSAQEKEGALAEAVVLLDILWTGRYYPLTAATLVVLAPYLLLSFFAGGFGLSPWLWGSAWLALFVLGRAAAQLIWSRIAIHRMDRRVAEVLGRPMLNIVLDLDDRTRSQVRGRAGILVKLTMPSKARRLNAL